MRRIAFNFLKVLDILEDVAMVTFMAIATLITFTQVVFRYVFNDSLYWAEEVVLYSIICMSFVGASMGVRKHAHISVDILNAVAGPSANRWLHMIAAVLGMAFGAILFYYGSQLFLSTLERNQMSPAMRIPLAWVYLPIPVSGGLIIMRYATLLMRAWRSEPESYAVDQDTLV